MPSAREIVRIVLIVVCVAITLYLLFLLRKPITWLLISIFLAVALSAPVNALAMRIRRGLAIAIVYIGLLAVPLALIALIPSIFGISLNVSPFRNGYQGYLISLFLMGLLGWLVWGVARRIGWIK